MAGVALGNIHVAFAGRCGTYGTELAVARLARRDAALFCMALGDIHADFVACVALGNINGVFAWQVRLLRH